MLDAFHVIIRIKSVEEAIAEVVAVVLCRCERTAVVSKPKMKKLLKQFGSFALNMSVMKMMMMMMFLELLLVFFIIMVFI